MQFKEVIGHNDIKELLIASVQSGRISHAQLFMGKTGFGTLPLALAFAQYIFCTNRKTDDSCGVCPACRKMQKLIHPDLHFVFPVISVDGKPKKSDDFIAYWRSLLNKNSYILFKDWQEAIPGLGNSIPFIGVTESDELVRKLSMKSFESEYKIILIWLPEKMNAEAANKLLKIFEEPFDKTLFLMVSEQPNQLLPTVASRLQKLAIPALKRDEIAKKLIEWRGIDEKRAQYFAKIARGSWREALAQLHESDDELNNQEQFVALMRLCWERKMMPVNKWVEELSKKGREKQKSFLLHALHMLRENFMRNFGKEELIYMNQREEGFAERFAPYIHEGNIIPLTEEFEQAYSDINANGNPKYIFTDLCIKVMQNIRP